MDMDDDDAFLYGDESPPPQAAPAVAPTVVQTAPVVEPKGEFVRRLV